MTIGKEIIESTKEMIGRLLMQYVREIDKAYMKSETTALKVTIPVTFKPTENGEVGIKVGIRMIPERIKDDIQGQMAEGQGSLLDKKEDSEK